MNRNSIEIKGVMEFDSVVDFLNDVLDSFKKKTICVQRGEDFVTVHPTEVLDMEVEAKNKNGKQKISIELSWKEEVKTPEEPEAQFCVSSQEPEIPAEAEADKANEFPPAMGW